MVRVADRNWIPFPVMGLHGSTDISHQMCMQFLFIYLFIYLFILVTHKTLYNMDKRC